MQTDFGLSVGPATAVVIGGGVVGLATALSLQLDGMATTLIDMPSDSPAASWGNAGHIAIEQVEPLASRAAIRSMPGRLFWRGGALSLPPRDLLAWVPFAMRLLAAASPARFAVGCAALTGALEDAMGAWKRLLEQVSARELLLEDGHFIVWETDRSARAGRARWAAANTGRATFRDATPDELSELAKLTRGPIAGAVRFSGSGQISDLDALAQALIGGFKKAGGARVEARIDHIAVEGGRAVALQASGTRHQASAIVVTAGAASRALLEPIGHGVPLIAERGYHIQSQDTAWPMGTPPVVFEDRSMIVTRFRSGLRAASFVEFGRLGRAADARKWARLRKHVAELGLSFDQPGREWMGARPTLPDYLPAIGRSRRAGNLFYAFGHQHLGLTLAAATAEAVRALVAGKTTPFDIRPFDIDRFRGGA
ncbi:FAD-dependent oxidoreductase [Sphingomonas sp. MAH-20]|uniref:FAD-dependent oxidoreductase n=1 Tax=Sphingomonas horti TaxID=2682842 RepID=A0A6I4J2S2_9SPHN|nr:MULTISPECIES: FAD-binding oxidoreductase [Sphingomonas]MBA2918887.1 FAD-binding oxidoreductase [Sphingomonas sp. CGMCC 1.13658]MVO78920.1 FAD-dependent oxidoreductase [Sphingomonas horti]